MQTPSAHIAPLPSPARPVSMDDFPPEVVHRIIRHLSSTPRVEHWTCNVPPATVRSLFLTNGPFPAAAASIFDTVTTVSGRFLPNTPPTPRGAVLRVTTNTDHKHLTSLLEAAGDKFVSLNVLHGCLNPRSPALHSAWVVAAATHCSSLRQLSLKVGIVEHPALVDLLAARGGGLEALTLSGPLVPTPIAEAVALNCGRLRRLRVDLTGSNADGVVPMLRGVGEGLTELSLVSSSSWASLPALKAAQETCTQLRRLEVRYMCGCGNAQHLIRQIVDRNGASLHMLALSAGMAKVPLLEGVAAAWPDVCFDVKATGDAAPSVLTALNGRIVNLKILFFDGAVAAHEYDCSLVETLLAVRRQKHATPCMSKVLTALAAKGGLPALRHAGIVCREHPLLNLSVPGAALLVLKAAGGLLSLDFTSVWLSVGAFEAVAKANPGLVNVSIHFFGLKSAELPPSYVQVLADVVTSFGRFCPSLAHILVEDRCYKKGTRFDAVANAYIPLRTRCVSVSVCGVQYLT